MDSSPGVVRASNFSTHLLLCSHRAQSRGGPASSQAKCDFGGRSTSVCSRRWLKIHASRQKPSSFSSCRGTALLTYTHQGSCRLLNSLVLSILSDASEVWAVEPRLSEAAELISQADWKQLLQIRNWHSHSIPKLADSHCRFSLGSKFWVFTSGSGLDYVLQECASVEVAAVHTMVRTICNDKTPHALDG